MKRFANVGRMFWALDPITGEVEPLTGNWVGNVMRKMRFYHAELAAAIQIAGWMPSSDRESNEMRLDLGSLMR